VVEGGVVYQIYPRSFNDSDGVGDMPGITEKTDLLDDLGVDVVWLCPVYDSPNADNGYDIRDYRSIMAEFGTMADWENLSDALHDRGIRLIMDLVVNHTSDEHEWFRRSRRREGEYADYYWWREGRDADAVDWGSDRGPAGEAPPNAWQSLFGDDDAYRRESVTLFTTLLHTLRGTPYVYQGEELGMTNYPFESVDELRDVDTLTPLRRAIDDGEVASFEAVKEGVRANSRDNARTPMQWTDGDHAGFIDEEPWIGVNPNHDAINLERERADEGARGR
jgi:glycosidase